MHKKRIRLQCSGCGQFFLLSPKESKPSKNQNTYCKKCKPNQGTNTHMILIEVQEHAHLLNLYHSLYTFTTEPNEFSQQVFITALKECNMFFTGGH